jgi:hypothetical protein
MVATAVLVLIVGMMSSMLATMGQNWRNAQKRVNNFTKARAMLDMMAHDIQSGIFRSDLPAFPTTLPSGTQGFYTLRPGISTGSPGANLRYVSAVSYDLADPTDKSVLRRSDQAVLFSDASSNVASLVFGSNAAFPTTTPRETAPGVINFNFAFVQQDGTMTTTYNPPGSSNPTHAIGITLAVVDDQTLQVLNNLSAGQGQITTLRSDLAVPAGLIPGSVKASWDQYLNTQITWKSYPQGLGIGFTVFERYVVLPSSL